MTDLNHGQPVNAATPTAVVILLISLIVACWAATGQSLWIDEANSALKAVQPSFRGFLDLMAVERGSDLQMPGYMLALWGWGRVFSTSEYGLRSLNILFFLGAQAAFCFSLRASAKERCFVLLASMASPFLWSYLDEARPYIMQFCGASLMSVAVWNNTFYPRRESLAADLALFCLGSAVLCASSLLGVIHTLFFGLLLLASLFLGKQLGAVLKQPINWATIAGTAIIMGALGVYYAWTLTLGAKASGVGQTSPATLLFAAYELLGFAGFGPGRIELREAGPRALVPYAGFLVLGFVPYLLAGLWLAAERPKIPRSKWLPAITMGILVLSAFLAIAAAGFLGDFRVVGRHFMPIAPFLLLTIGLLWSQMWNHGAWKAAVVASILIFFAGSITQRLNPRFAKDDYRSAAGVVRAALSDHRTVWWAADPAAANYYGVFPVAPSDQLNTPAAQANTSPDTAHPIPTTRNTQPAPPRIFFANRRSADYLASLPPADVVILSKTDIYDSTGALRVWMKENRLTVTNTFPAFTVWEKTEKLKY